MGVDGTAEADANNELYTAVVTSIFDGGLNVVKVLFDRTSLNIDKQGRSGNSVLMWAALWGQTDVVTYLIGKGADINLENNDGDSALSLAAKAGNRKIVKLLKKAGATA
jgi:ankyrin repeat protein